MLQSYADQHGFSNRVHYTDDGWSGGNFDRPAWKRLVDDIKRVNALITSLQKTIAALVEWLQGIKETLTQHETISNPDDYNLGNVLLSYLDLRKADRELWAHRAQTKASLKDLQAVSNAVTFLREKKIDAVQSLGAYLSRTGARMKELRSMVRSKKQRIRDIDALLAADKMSHDLQPVYYEYSAIRWKGAKERASLPPMLTSWNSTKKPT